MRVVPGLFLFCISLTVSAQGDYQWWNEINQWDGVRHWESYIEKVPAKMGPNALPVPSLYPLEEGNGFLYLSHRWHTMKGELSQDILLKYTAPLFSERVYFAVYGVALEHYKMSPMLRDERHSRDKDGRGIAVGDVLFECHIYLRKDKESGPEVLFRTGLRTASGGKLSAARYTDYPGYWFDFMAEWFSHSRWKLYTNAGLYVWQVNYETEQNFYMQDDALLLGLGTAFHGKDMAIRAGISGYWGYLNIGDRPLIINASYQWNDPYNINLIFRQGLQDYRYSTIGIQWGLPLKIKKSPN